MPRRRSFKTDEGFIETKLLEDAEGSYRPKLCPSGHDISQRFANDNGCAMPSNCWKSATHNLKPGIKPGLARHPARFPEKLPRLFIGRVEIQTAPNTLKGRTWPT